MKCAEQQQTQNGEISAVENGENALGLGSIGLRKKYSVVTFGVGLGWESPSGSCEGLSPFQHAVEIHLYPLRFWLFVQLEMALCQAFE